MWCLETIIAMNDKAQADADLARLQRKADQIRETDGEPEELAGASFVRSETIR